MDTINGVMWVALGSVLGGTARFWLSGLRGAACRRDISLGNNSRQCQRRLSAWHSCGIGRQPWDFRGLRPWQFAAIGILGTYTTVSSFSLQTLALARDGEMLRAAGNMVLSLSLCLLAVAGGFAAGLHAFGLREVQRCRTIFHRTPPADEQVENASASRHAPFHAGGKHSGTRPAPIFPWRSEASSARWRVFWFPFCS